MSESEFSVQRTHNFSWGFSCPISAVHCGTTLRIGIRAAHFLHFLHHAKNAKAKNLSQKMDAKKNAIKENHDFH